VGFELTTLVVIGTDCIGSCKFNYHTITTTTAPDIFSKVVVNTYSGQGALHCMELGLWWLTTLSSNQLYLRIAQLIRVRVMVLNASFNNISAILWRSVLSVEETGVPGEKSNPNLLRPNFCVWFIQS
jgi:hypothetical protein